jgi:hypothetical protein
MVKARSLSRFKSVKTSYAVLVKSPFLKKVMGREQGTPEQGTPEQGTPEHRNREHRNTGTGNTGTGNTGTGNSFSHLDILNFLNPTQENAPILRHPKPKPGTFL